MMLAQLTLLTKITPNVSICDYILAWASRLNPFDNVTVIKGYTNNDDLNYDLLTHIYA